MATSRGKVFIATIGMDFPSRARRTKTYRLEGSPINRFQYSLDGEDWENLQN